MAHNIATAPDRFGETLTEFEQLVDIWSALADTKDYKRLLEAKIRVLKLRTHELPDSIRLRWNIAIGLWRHGPSLSL